MIKLLLDIMMIRVKSLENVQFHQFHLLLLTFSFPECPNTIPWRQRWWLPIALWLHLLQGLHFNLFSSFFAFDCIWMFPFSRRRKLLRHGLKRTMHSPIWIQGWRRNTSTSSQGVLDMDEFAQTTPNFDCRFYQCFESIQLYGVSLVQLVDDLEGGRLVGREQESLKMHKTWKGAHWQCHCEET